MHGSSSMPRRALAPGTLGGISEPEQRLPCKEFGLRCRCFGEPRDPKVQDLGFKV